jgi:hypothetical protein
MSEEEENDQDVEEEAKPATTKKEGDSGATLTLRVAGQERRKKKQEGGERSLPPVKTEAALKISLQTILSLERILLKLIDAGASNLMVGYGSVMIANDLLHSAGLLSNTAYQDIRIEANIMALIADLSAGIEAIFGGNSPFSPSLRTKVDISRPVARAAEVADMGD